MSQTVKNWFDSLEEILTKEAKFAGLLEHGTTVGNAREFFVRRVLKSFIPDYVHIGTGQIISSKEEQRSNQIDIVLFDSRFPYYRSDAGSALYPIEGTIATIEIKSTLNSEKLREALDNCASVMKLPISYDESDLKTKIASIMTLYNITERQAGQIYQWDMAPRTYIIGFQGYKEDYKALVDAISKWQSDTGNNGNYYAPFLPRLILAEGVIGASKDDIISFGESKAGFRATKSTKRLGMFAAHILKVIQKRFPPAINHLTGGKYNIDQYDPSSIYAQEYENKEGRNLTWEK